MKLLISFLFFTSITLPAYSQKVIELKEVKVYPEKYAYDLIGKMKIAIKNNYQKDISDYQIDIECIKNDTDTFTNINQQSTIQINALKTHKFKILKSNGKANFQEEFYKNYDSSRLFKYGLLEGRLNYVLDLAEFPFFNNFSDYNYQVYDVADYYEISFTSIRKFTGKLKIAKGTYNILELEFEDLSNSSYVNRGLTTGTTKYINEIINIKKSKDEAHLFFSENENKKILLNKIISSIELSQFEVTRFELNKANKILSKDNMRLITNLKLQKLNL
jgi:hypothetical protein